MADRDLFGFATLTEKQAAAVNSLVLAYLGDAVWSLFVRRQLAATTDLKAGELHKIASGEVNAGAQARLAEAVADKLTEAEHDMYIRGRNAKAHHKAKNQSGADYRKATGMEAVVGYLYLVGDTARIVELLSTSAEPQD